MLVEPNAPTHSTARDFIPNAFPAMDQSNVSGGPLHLLASGRESLAASPDAAVLQRATLELAYRLFLSWTAASPGDAPWRESLFPALVDVTHFRPAVEQRSFVASREQEQLAAKLRAAFEAEPLEDGLDHPAETTIRGALQSGKGRDVLEWLRTFSLDTAHPGFAASVLRCLGRQERPGTGSWRVGLVRDGLATEDVGIRDAAIQAAELWGDRNMRRVLEEHSEPVLWLRDYVRDVLEDLPE